MSEFSCYPVSDATTGRTYFENGYEDEFTGQSVMYEDKSDKPKINPKPKIVMTTTFSMPKVEKANAQPKSQKAEQKEVSWWDKAVAVAADVAVDMAQGAANFVAGLSQMSCSGNVGLSELCDEQVAVINDKIGRAINTKLNMLLNSGVFHFTETVRIPAIENNEVVGYVKELEQGKGALWVKFGFRNGYIGTDSAGAYKLNTVDEGEHAECTGAVQNCTPYNGVAGAVIIGKPEVDVEGWTMLETVGDDANWNYCSYRPMLDRTFGEPVFEYEGEYVVRHRYIDYESDPDGVEVDKFYKVSPDGFLYCGDSYCPTIPGSETDNPIAYAEANAEIVGLEFEECEYEGMTFPNCIEGKPLQVYMDENKGFSYYLVNGDGEYLETQEVDGEVIPVPIAADDKPWEKDYKLILREDVTLKDIIDGNLEVGEAGMTLEEIAAKALPLEATITIYDGREGREDTAPEVIGPLSVSDIVNMSTRQLPPRFYDNGEFDPIAVIEGTGVLDKPIPKYVFGANVMFQYMISCDLEEPDFGFGSVPEHVTDDEETGPSDGDTDSEAVDAGTDTDTESDIPDAGEDTDTAGDVDTDSDVDTDADTDADSDVDGDTDSDADTDTWEEEEDAGPEADGGTF